MKVLCTFGPPNERRKRWILKFEDTEMSDMHFDDEVEAKSCWRRLKDAWTCTLYVIEEMENGDS